MQYRQFGRLDWKVSALGFGCMRLPTTDHAPGSQAVNEKETESMLLSAIDRGINYVDTAYLYHNGMSETVVGKILKGGYRRKVKLATKSPVMLLKKPDDFDAYLAEQLKRLQADHIEFYLLHALSAQRWPVILGLDVLRKAEAAVRDGRIGHFGFSFHDNFETFKKIVDAYDRWTLCQIQYNYMDIENQAGTKGLRYAASKGLAVVVMEPLLGGRLSKPPRAVQDIFDEFPVKHSPADWALQWTWNQPEVAVTLSGMSEKKHVEENLRSAENSAIGSLGPEESRLIERVREKFRERTVIPCTKCGYCVPCPNGVDIPRNFELYNDGVIYEDLNTPRMLYMRFLGESERASACSQCGTCEEKCPQGIAVGEWMLKVDAALGKGKVAVTPAATAADAAAPTSAATNSTAKK
jgi:predicted aldo/keto reductase-like oxidoreductase